MPVDSIIKSSRFLQSRRYTHENITDAQDVFDRVLDLSAAEIYSQQNLIPSSSVPVLTATGATYSVDGEPILKYWKEHALTPSSVLGASNREEVWFFLETPEAKTTPFEKNATQQGNFVSNKYVIPSLSANTTTDTVRGYKVVAWKNSVSPSNLLSDVTDYVFDYKTGVLEFLTNAKAAGVSDVFITAYQYIGRTLASDQTAGYSGSFSGSFKGDGSLLTNVPAGSVVGLNVSQIATGNITASVTGTSQAFRVISGSTNLITVGTAGAVTASLFTGSFEGDSNGTFTGSFTGSATGTLTGTLTGEGSGSFSGSFEGNGGGLTNIPANSIVGLNLSRVASGSVSASIGVGDTSLQLVSASVTLATFGNGGGLTLTGTSSLGTTSFTGSVTITDNLTVFGTASFTSVTSSELFVSGSRILLHTNNGAGVRFGGMDVIDDSVTGTTGSLLWDSQEDRWVYSKPAGATYSGGMLISGPRNILSLGEEVALTRYYVPRSQGGDHIEDSNMYSSGSRVLINKAVPETTAEVEISGSVSITGSTLQNSPDGTVLSKYALAVSQSAWFASTNVGYPVGNQWGSSLAGSVFANYNHNTDTATILRLMAGFLSASLPSPMPNTRYYNSATSEYYSSATYDAATYIKGLIPQDYENSALAGAADVSYLVGKGFASVGSRVFSGISTIYYQNTFGAQFSSGTPAGTTTVTSSADPNLFNMAALGDTVRLTGSLSFRYSDNSSKTTTATSQSTHFITQVGPGTGTAVKVYSIPTANASVISPVWQDGKILQAFPRALFNGGNNIDSRAASSISSSGYYYYTASLILSSGSSAQTSASAQVELFWAPADILASTLALNTITITSASTANTVVSRSLSGAPYISSSTYSYVVTMSGLFDPLYAADDTIGSVAVSSGSVTVPETTATINTSGRVGIDNTIYSASNVARSVGTVPYRTDQVRFNVPISSSFSTNTNIQAIGSSSNSFILLNTAKNRNNISTSPTTTFTIFSPGTFGQPLASGSMATFGRAQGTDPGSNSGTTPDETFLGENNRRYVSAPGYDVLEFSAAPFSQSFGLYNLPAQELQVKPGFLVKPGGAYKYWLTDPSPSDTFKYYIKEFVRTGGGTINVDFYSTGSSRPTLVTWYDAGSNPDGIAAGIMFESTTVANLTAQLITSDARFFNLSTAGGATTFNPTAGTAYNPFGSKYLLYNGGSNPSTGKYTMTPDNGAGAALDSIYTKYYLVVRYKGDVPPLTRIQVSYT